MDLYTRSVKGQNRRLSGVPSEEVAIARQGKSEDPQQRDDDGQRVVV